MKVSHSLDLCTVAEAVETAAQVAILREVGADVGQGYFFAPPLGADEAYALTSADTLPVFSLTTSAMAAEEEPTPTADGGTAPFDEGDPPSGDDGLDVSSVTGADAGAAPGTRPHATTRH